MDAIHTFTGKKYTLKIVDDSSSESPRDWDNMTKMVCFHSRYDLGDKHNYNSDDYSGWDEMKKAIIVNEDVAIIEPLYMYDHSGQTISTTPFSCPWDSGQIGWVFITKEAIRKELNVKRITKKALERAGKNLKAEVGVYDQYIRGDVYGFEVEQNETGKNEDSCYGFFGDKFWTNGMSDNMPDEVVEDLREQLEKEYGKEPSL